MEYYYRTLYFGVDIQIVALDKTISPLFSSLQRQPNTKVLRIRSQDAFSSNFTNVSRPLETLDSEANAPALNKMFMISIAAINGNHHFIKYISSSHPYGVCSVIYFMLEAGMFVQPVFDFLGAKSYVERRDPRQEARPFGKR